MLIDCRFAYMCIKVMCWSYAGHVVHHHHSGDASNEFIILGSTIISLPSPPHPLPHPGSPSPSHNNWLHPGLVPNHISSLVLPPLYLICIAVSPPPLHLRTIFSNVQSPNEEYSSSLYYVVHKFYQELRELFLYRN